MLGVLEDQVQALEVVVQVGERDLLQGQQLRQRQLFLLLNGLQGLGVLLALH